MVCLGCGRLSTRLCTRCLECFEPAPVRSYGPVEVWSRWRHEGPARSLVHHLKFRGVALAAVMMAEMMAPVVPADAILVPVPRVAWRRLRYGVDTGSELAAQLARITGCPMVRGLAAPMVAKSHTGASRALRSQPRFSLVTAVGSRGVLVDDVVTTGSTLVAAAGAGGINRAITFTAVLQEK